MLAKESDYGHDLDIGDLFHTWKVERIEEDKRLGPIQFDFEADYSQGIDQ